MHDIAPGDHKMYTNDQRALVWVEGRYLTVWPGLKPKFESEECIWVEVLF